MNSVGIKINCFINRNTLKVRDLYEFKIDFIADHVHVNMKLCEVRTSLKDYEKNTSKKSLPIH